MSKKSKFILLIFGLAIFSYLVYDFGVANIVVNIKKLRWWFAADVGVWAVVYFCNAKAWFAILRDHVDGVSFPAVYKLTVTGFAINYITPFLNLGGEPYRVVELQKKAGTHRAVSSVILYNMVRMLSHFLFWFLAVLMMFLFFSPTGSFAVALIVVFLFVLGLFLLFLAGHKNGIFTLWFSWSTAILFCKSWRGQWRQNGKVCLLSTSTSGSSIMRIEKHSMLQSVTNFWLALFQRLSFYLFL